MFLGIDLENIVYYRDNTHYFVMTAKKQSLLDKGVIINVSMLTSLACVQLAHSSVRLRLRLSCCSALFFSFTNSEPFSQQGSNPLQRFENKLGV